MFGSNKKERFFVLLLGERKIENTQHSFHICTCFFVVAKQNHAKYKVAASIIYNNRHGIDMEVPISSVLTFSLFCIICNDLSHEHVASLSKQQYQPISNYVKKKVAKFI